MIDAKSSYEVRSSADDLLDVSISTAPGLLLSASYGPALAPQRGAVVLLHGFAAERFENGLFPPLMHALRMRGFSTLTYDWRGLGKSSGDFGASHLQDHVWDFQYVLDWLADNGMPRHTTYALGFSLGATIIIASADIDTTPVAGAVLLSPAVRPARDMWPRYSGLQEELRACGYVSKPDNGVRLRRPILESLRDTDLSDRAFNLGIPTLVCHGTADTRIPVATTRACMYKARPDLVSAIYFNGASHSFRPAPHRDRLTHTISDWLDATAPRATGQDQCAARAGAARAR